MTLVKTMLAAKTGQDHNYNSSLQTCEAYKVYVLAWSSEDEAYLKKITLKTYFLSKLLLFESLNKKKNKSLNIKIWDNPQRQ